MAMSAPVTDLLKKLEIEPTAHERIKAFMAQGKRLRSAFAILYKGQGNGDSYAIENAKALCAKAFPEAHQRRLSAIKSKVHHVYASTAAVAFEHASTSDGRACLQVEAASRSDRNAPFGWNNKISLQLKDQEVIQIVAVLRNWLDIVEITNHGANRDKRLTIRKQDGGSGYVISVRQGTTARVVPIPPFETFALFSICLKVICANAPHMPVDLVLQMCKEVAMEPASRAQDH
jgi:hypothetical protein